MEVIKEPSMQTVCRKCGCEFRFDKDDVKQHLYGRKGIAETCFRVNCPICKSIVVVWKKEENE